MVVVDGDAYYSRPGPRLADGVRQLGHLLQPDVVQDPELPLIELRPAAIAVWEPYPTGCATSTATSIGTTRPKGLRHRRPPQCSSYEALIASVDGLSIGSEPHRELDAERAGRDLRRPDEPAA